MEFFKQFWQINQYDESCRKGENNHIKEADQNGMYLVLLTLVTIKMVSKVDHSALGDVVMSHILFFET